MCSLNEADENVENLVADEKTVIKGSTCRSCTNSAFVVLRKKDVYCKSCFLATETHKFRASLGKSKMMKPQDKVLVAHSGSQSSAALLHLLHSGVTEDQHKKLLFGVLVLYIDEGAILGLGVEERQEIVRKIKEDVSSYGFPVFISSISELFRESPLLDSSLNVDDKFDGQLMSLFENTKTFTAKEDLLQRLREKLIIKAAEMLGCNKIFTAEVGTDIAMKLLSNFSTGRGATASFETGFCDSRHPHIKILRPLRDFTRKEIIFYNRSHNIEGLNILSLTTKSASNVSIKKLTEKFVTGLQEDFPSTVYTIFRTGEKLSSNVASDEVIENVCVLCGDKVRTPKGRSSYTAVDAAKFSRNVSRKKSDCGRKNGGCCGNCLEGGKVNIDSEELEKYLCYGCTLIVRDMKTVDCLPEDVLQSATQKRDFESMREQISEFLIENSSEIEV